MPITAAELCNRPYAVLADECVKEVGLSVREHAVRPIAARASICVVPLPVISRTSKSQPLAQQ